MSFCTAINCMDGRTQLPVNQYLCSLLGVQFVDTITEAGPVKILAEEQNSQIARSILNRVDVSLNKHKSRTIAVVAHYDCAGDCVSEDIQLQQLEIAIKWLTEKYPGVRIIGLWMDSNWIVKAVF